MFRRWANSADRQPVEVAEGGCSGGFVNLKPVLLPLMTTVTVGTSLWQIFPALAAVDAAAEAIRLNPMITHCGQAHCLECQDAVQGGPIPAAEAPL